LGITEGDKVKTLNGDLIIHGLYGAVKKLIDKVEILENNLI
jgi:hypothetical protein